MTVNPKQTPLRHHDGDYIPYEEIMELVEAFGLTIAPNIPLDWWQPIARECGLPELTVMDVLPAALWNQAVDIANQRSEAR